jgi:trans-aconitate 2-methyltransferase
MADWNAAQYLKFERERTRPARDLLTAISLERPARIVDLGCGPGNSTQLLVDRYPSADVLGLDISPDMLDKARAAVPRARFEQADVAAWEPAVAADLIFANAVLQWLPDHPRLLPRLVSCLAPGGVLAVQMPDNLDEFSHALMRKVASEASFAEKLAGAAGARTALGSFEQLHGWLKPVAAEVDLWRTTYVHPLDGAPAIVEWLKATGLRPFIDPLNDAERAQFLARYEAELEQAYPRQADGKSLLRFPRLFIVATKA